MELTEFGIGADCAIPAKPAASAGKDVATDRAAAGGVALAGERLATGTLAGERFACEKLAAGRPDRERPAGGSSKEEGGDDVSGSTPAVIGEAGF